MKKAFISLCLSLGLAIPASATIQYVQGNHDSNQSFSNPSLSVAFSQSVTQGDLLVVYVAPASGENITISVVDSRGNSYSASTYTTGIASCNVSEGFYYAIATAGGSDTVTATIPSGNANGMALAIAEYSGIATVDPLDAQTGTSQTSCPWGTSPQSANLTSSNASDLLIGAAALTANDGWTAGTGFTLRTTGTNIAYALEDKSVSSAGAYNGTFSLSTGGNWIASAVAFKASGASDAPTCGHLLSADSSVDAPGDTDWEKP
jgi:hypothetical protein